MTFRTRSVCSRLTAFVCILLLLGVDMPLFAQEPVAQTTTAAPVRTAAQLDSLVAPIALYPDPLLAQVLAASTYPLDVVQAGRWLKENSKLKGEQLTQAAAKQPWEASVQALVAFPDALTLLDNNIKWTTELGNAVLDQQSDVMDAVQRMRAKAKQSGKLNSTKEQTVETKIIESKTIVEIQPADPQVIYVPTYEPEYIYGAPAYPYPPMYNPAGYVATGLVSFGLGVAIGSMWGGCCGGGGWGWNCGWGGNNNININNDFSRRYGYNNNGGNRNNIGNGKWQHDSQFRKSVPYSNRDTAQRYGGGSRDASGRTERFDNRGASRGMQPSTRDIQPSLERSSERFGNRSDFGGGDRVGNRSIDNRGGGRGNNAFGGMDSRQRTQAASDRGFNSSRGSSNRASSANRGSFGGSRSGGGRSGGGRSGGGRRR